MNAFNISGPFYDFCLPGCWLLGTDSNRHFQVMNLASYRYSTKRYNGDPYEIRTRVTAVKGQCLYHLTNGSEGVPRRNCELHLG